MAIEHKGLGKHGSCEQHLPEADDPPGTPQRFDFSHDSFTSRNGKTLYIKLQILMDSKCLFLTPAKSCRFMKK